MSASSFDSFVGRPLSGAEIKEIVAQGPRPQYSFVLLGPCQIQLRPVRTITADIRLRRDKITDESYLAYLGEARGPAKFFDPITTEQLPRIRLYVPARDVSFPTQREWFACFASRPVIIKTVNSKGESISATVTLDNTTGESTGIASFYGVEEGIHQLTVQALGYDTVKEEITVPPYLVSITLKETVVAEYKLLRYGWYLDYSKGGFPSTPEGKKGKYNLHVRILLSGTVPKGISEDRIKKVFKEKMKGAAKATAVYVNRDGNGIDDLLWTMYREDEDNGYYGDIETDKEFNSYNEKFDFYGFFKNLDQNKQYTWTFKWTIYEDEWGLKQSTLV